MGKQWKQCQTLFWGAPKSLQMVTAAMKLRHLFLGRKVMTNLDRVLKSRDITLLAKFRLSQSYGSSSSHVWMWELDYKESCVLKNCCFWTMVLEKTLESPLDYKKIKPVHPKENQSWIFIGKIDAEAEATILWLPDANSWLTGKDPDAGKDWGQKKKGMTEDEMVGWYHWLNGHEFEQGLGVGDEQGNLACHSPWGWENARHNCATELNWLSLHSLLFWVAVQLFWSTDTLEYLSTPYNMHMKYSHLEAIP